MVLLQALASPDTYPASIYPNHTLGVHPININQPSIVSISCGFSVARHHCRECPKAGQGQNHAWALLTVVISFVGRVSGYAKALDATGPGILRGG
jgi:hypothetical protein